MARPELGAVAGTILVFLFFAVAARGTGMFSALGIVTFLEVSAQLGIIAVAAALLMIGGEFDLSVGSMIGAAGVVLAIPAVIWGWPLVAVHHPGVRAWRRSSAGSTAWWWCAPACPRSSSRSPGCSSCAG